MFVKHFSNITPTVLAKALFETKDENKNNDLTNAIISGLRDLKDETDKMSEDEKEIEKPVKILDIVKKVLEFNDKI